MDDLDLYPAVTPWMLYLQIRMEKVERFAFYERAKKAFAIVHTGWVCKDMSLWLV